MASLPFTTVVRFLDPTLVKLIPILFSWLGFRGDLVGACHQTELFTGFRFMNMFKQIAQVI
ncbi:hypothetical protein D8M19_04675 [Corynebacterium pseudodiphtheriticum]|nr:hypothetical protein D8M19_04675 [Corynebacterium pseudodiphtheriticum]